VLDLVSSGGFRRPLTVKRFQGLGFQFCSLDIAGCRTKPQERIFLARQLQPEFRSRGFRLL
jgi:hypothetical protein